MSNLLKRASIINKDERVIDYNRIIQEKLDALKKAAPKDSDGFIEGLHSPQVEQMVDEDGNPVDMSIFGEDTAVATQEAEAQEVPDLDEVKAQADAILEDARNQADRILEDARSQAEQIRQDAHDDGFDAGTAEAQNKYEQDKKLLQSDYDSRKAALEKEYNELKAKMEPELVNVILEVFKNAIYAISDSDQQVILSLVNHVLRDANISNEFTIKVSHDDYEFMIQNQGKLYCAMNKDIQADIIEDSKLSKGQCLIEADSGVYDCSLDIQLENLIKSIKLLSSSCN